MAGEILYLKTEQKTEVTTEDVYLKDLGKLTCTDKHILARVKAIKVHHFQNGKDPRTVISILKIIEEIQKLYPALTIENIGESDMIVELVKVDRTKGFMVYAKIALVALVSFFGTAFTIMGFHNDIGIHDVFALFYEIVMGKPSSGFTVLEIFYSIGLAVGIILFFNHVGGRRITKDPTPIEVAMRTYEDDVNNALIETANREGKTKDV